MSGLERVTLVPDDSDEEERVARDSSSRARQSYQQSQRTSQSQPRPSTSTSHSHHTSRSRGKRVAYQEPDNYANLDESAITPPVPRRGDEDEPADPYYQRPARLEDDLQDAPSDEKPSVSKQRRYSARRERNVPQGEEELTEVAAPPPVPKDSDEDNPNKLEKQRLPEDEGVEDEDDDHESYDPAPRHQPRHASDLLKSEPEAPQLLTQLYTISYLIFFAIMGTLARLGTQWITFYPGTPIVTPVIWANFAGSFIIGFLAEDQGLFRQDAVHELHGDTRSEKHGEDLRVAVRAAATKRKKAIPLYIGLATGFCGSYTSFSSFTRDVFLALSNNLATPIDHPHPGRAVPSPSSTIHRNGGYAFEALLQVIIYTLALSLGGLLIGAQVAALADPITPRIHGSFLRRFVDPSMVVLAFGCWLGAIFLSIFPPSGHDMWRSEVTLALVFAPLGCLLRFYASLKLNGLVPAFPLGTFAVNMFGTAIEGMCYDLQHVRVGVMGMAGGGVIGCQVLKGVQDGFCGCLTTVSTWVAEINGLKRKHGWTYAFASVLGGFCLMVVIMGSVRWSAGYVEPVCDTGYPSKVHG